MSTFLKVEKVGGKVTVHGAQWGKRGTWLRRRVPNALVLVQSHSNAVAHLPFRARSHWGTCNAQRSRSAARTGTLHIRTSSAPSRRKVALTFLLVKLTTTESYTPSAQQREHPSYRIRGHQGAEWAGPHEMRTEPPHVLACATSSAVGQSVRLS